MFGRRKRQASEGAVGLPAHPTPGPDDIPPVFRANADYERRQMEFLWRVGRGDAIDRRFLGIWDQVFGNDGQARDEIDDFLRGNRIRPTTPAELLEAGKTAADLKKLAEAAGIAKSGKKAELAARIAEALPPEALQREIHATESYRLTDVGEILVEAARGLWKLEKEQMLARMVDALLRGDPQEAAAISNAYDDRQVFAHGFGGGVSVDGDPVAELLADPAFDALELSPVGRRELAARIAVCTMRGTNPREWPRYLGPAIDGEFRHPEVEAFLAAPVGGMVVGMDSSPESQLFLFAHTVASRVSSRRQLRGLREAGGQEVRIMTVGDDCPTCSQGPLESPINAAIPLPRHWGCRCGYVIGGPSLFDEV